MSRHLTPIDISNKPDLVRIVEEVKTTNQPRILQHESKPVAVIMPTAHPKTKRTAKTSVQEALALAGAWGERDWHEVEAELDRIRHSSKPTPPFVL